MNNFIIVGGGINGILLAGLLERRGVAFQGLEKLKSLGKENLFGQFRLYQDNSVSLVKELNDTIQWSRVEEQTQERKKGEWVAAHSDFIDEEKAFLGSPFYQPNDSLKGITTALINSIAHKFQTEKEVEIIDTDKRMVTCTDGTQYFYEKMAWCADLKSLLKIVKTPAKISFKKSKKNEDSQGGIHLELEVTNALFPFQGSVVFPFRYKDYKLRALGMSAPNATSNSSSQKVHWIVFLERELAEDREEVAKVIRALKRELLKDFPELKPLITKEKIVFHPKLDSYTATEVKGLELFPSIFYIGSEIKLSDSLVSNSPLDLTLENCKRFQEML